MPFYGPPLDYSFKELANVRDVPKEPPQQGTVKGVGGEGGEGGGGGWGGGGEGKKERPKTSSAECAERKTFGGV